MIDHDPGAGGAEQAGAQASEAGRVSRKTASQTDEMHVPMNDCYADYGAVDARQITKLFADLAVEA